MADNNTNNAPRRRGGGGFGGGQMGMPGEKAKDFRGTFKKLFHYIGRYKAALIIVVIFSVGGTIFGILGPRILGNATTELFNGIMAKLQGTGDVDFTKIGNIMVELIILYIVSALLNLTQGIIMATIVQKTSYRLREDISTKINRMPMKYFESRTVGEVLSRITNDVDTLAQGLNQSGSQLVTSVTMLIGIIVMMLSISPLMTLVAFVILPLSAILMGVIIKMSQKYFISQQRFLGQVNGQVEEVYSGQNIVKAFCKEKDMNEEFDETNNSLFNSAWKSQFLSGLMMPIGQFVSNLGYVGVVLAGGWLTVRGTIQVGDIQSFIQYVNQFTQPIMQVTQISTMLQSTAAASERVFEFLGEEEEDVTVENPAKLVCGGDVEFEHVHFGYDPEKIIIGDFSCKVDPGKMVAIVGPTGAGKTTIVKLLMRFYDVNSGDIKVDGNDVRRYNRSDLRQNFGMVLQDTWLFKGTIMENIRYGRLEATDDEVIAAAKAAHAHHFISTLPASYQMELNEDASNVSQGQKQLLTIARAILADSPILILDEATSSVDTRTEARIQRAMENLMRGRTSFVIAHRLSTIRDADVILVMKDGDIIEQGKHEELLEKGGFYSNLYQSQFEEVTA